MAMKLSDTKTLAEIATETERTQPEVVRMCYYYACNHPDPSISCADVCEGILLRRGERSAGQTLQPRPYNRRGVHPLPTADSVVNPNTQARTLGSTEFQVKRPRQPLSARVALRREAAPLIDAGVPLSLAWPQLHNKVPEYPRRAAYLSWRRLEAKFKEARDER